MPVYSRITGDMVDFPTPDERQEARLARMRHIVWLGVKTLERARQEDGGTLVMYTLTYAKIGEWEPRHISGCMRWLRRQGVRGYVWVAELQKRGAVHYHVLALLPPGQRWRKPSESDGGWARGFTWVTTDIKRPFYIMKYLQKGGKDDCATRFPRGLRLYGIAHWVVRRYNFEDHVEYRCAQLPRWFGCAKDRNGDILCAVRVSGGVLFRGLVEYTPYSKAPLADVDSIGELMYASLWAQTDP